VRAITTRQRREDYQGGKIIGEGRDLSVVKDIWGRLGECYIVTKKCKLKFVQFIRQMTKKEKKNHTACPVNGFVGMLFLLAASVG